MTILFMTKPSRWTARHKRPPVSRSFWASEIMDRQPERGPTVGYVVSPRPRLAETFTLNEGMAGERLGGGLRFFSIKDPKDEPVHARVALVRAQVTYLAIGRNR